VERRAVAALAAMIDEGYATPRIVAHCPTWSTAPLDRPTLRVFVADKFPSDSACSALIVAICVVWALD
jgi:hypothetical protein